MEISNCISAEALRNMQKEYSQEKCQKQLRSIGTRLEEAVKNFTTYIYVDSIYPMVKQELEELGYIVEDCSSQKDGPSYCIKW